MLDPAIHVRIFRPVALLAAVVVCAQLALAQDTVTIPKSRLQELERKEAELKALQGDVEKTKAENQRLEQQHQEDAAKVAAPVAHSAAPPRVSPPLASLPPLKEGEVVDAIDLANQYLADPAAADQRYRKHRFRVRGEIDGFERPLIIRNYRILLKTADRSLRVSCDFYPAEKFKAVFPVKNGTELDGLLANEARVPIAHVGKTVIIEGECTGHSESAVKLKACKLVTP